jgi:hypothetical protein
MLSIGAKTTMTAARSRLARTSLHVSLHERIAVVGGDGRPMGGVPIGPNVRAFPTPKYGVNGVLRRLDAALRSRRIDLVVVLTRFVDHSTASRVKAMCRNLGIRHVLVSGARRVGR